MWKTGRIGTVGSSNIYEYHAKVCDEAWDFGIQEGKIIKLTIRKVGEPEWLLNYDREWDVLPANEEVGKILQIILAEHN